MPKEIIPKECGWTDEDAYYKQERERILCPHTTLEQVGQYGCGDCQEGNKYGCVKEVVNTGIMRGIEIKIWGGDR